MLGVNNHELKLRGHHIDTLYGLLYLGLPKLTGIFKNSFNKDNLDLSKGYNSKFFWESVEFLQSLGMENHDKEFKFVLGGDSICERCRDFEDNTFRSDDCFIDEPCVGIPKRIGLVPGKSYQIKDLLGRLDNYYEQNCLDLDQGFFISEVIDTNLLVI